jgi:hypothetical protein
MRSPHEPPGRAGGAARRRYAGPRGRPRMSRRACRGGFETRPYKGGAPLMRATRIAPPAGYLRRRPRRNGLILSPSCFLTCGRARGSGAPGDAGACEAPSRACEARQTLARRLYVPCDRDVSPLGAPPRHFLTPPSASPFSGEGKREGTTPTGPVRSRGRREPLPAPPNGTVTGRRPFDEPGWLMTIILGK